MIRRPREDELERLQEIERAAGQAFAEIGMEAVARDEPSPVALLRRFQQAGRAWVQVDAQDRPIAYLIAECVDGCAHVEQVSVHPDHAGRGLGRELLAHLAEWAREEGLRGLTLTTFTQVPWNAPYYERCGFRRLAESELTPGLRAIRASEAARGLDRWPRACLRRDL